VALLYYINLAQVGHHWEETASPVFSDTQCCDYRGSSLLRMLKLFRVGLYIIALVAAVLDLT
jgi:hypothetical protein